MEQDPRELEEFEKPDTAYDLASTRQARNINVVHDGSLTFGERLSDRLAGFAGSWTFIITFFVILLSWILVNSIYLLGKPFDPFPFILLNLILSCLAAIQAPVIMMSQNRQEARDRIRAEHDYEINVKTEILVEEMLKKLQLLEAGQAQMKAQLAFLHEERHGDYEEQPWG